MAFSDLIHSVDDACLGAFGLAAEGIPVAYIPQDGSGTQTINGIIAKPPIEEEYLPGSSRGAAIVRLFVRFTEITPSPQKGDVLTINGRTYAIADVNVDPGGGAVLKLRTL